MTDKEWIAQIKTITNEDLLETLKYCGRDPYYDEIYQAVVKEIQRRMNGGKRKEE